MAIDRTHSSPQEELDKETPSPLTFSSFFIEFLGAQIDSMYENNRWDKIKTSKNGPSFSHAFFANDLMLFVKAKAKNCEAIIKVLDSFASLLHRR